MLAMETAVWPYPHFERLDPASLLVFTITQQAIISSRGAVSRSVLVYFPLNAIIGIFLPQWSHLAFRLESAILLVDFVFRSFLPGGVVNSTVLWCRKYGTWEKPVFRFLWEASSVFTTVAGLYSCEILHLWLR